MSKQYNFVEWLRKLLIISLLLGYAFLIGYYYKGYLNYDQFVHVTTFVVISLITLVLSLKSVRDEIALPKVNLGKFIYALPYVMFFCMFLEVWLEGHSGIFSVLTLITIFTLTFLSRYNSLTVPIAFASLATLISVLYGVYTPTFSKDAWRDCIQASQIIERGSLQDLTIVHAAYPFPLTSLLYAMYSTITVLDTPWSSSVVGLLYLLLLPLWVYLIARRFNIKYPHIAALLTLVTPLVVIWSVGFIPQTYALLMSLPLLFLDLHSAILIVFTAALTLGHGGVALWTILMLIVLAFAKKILGDKREISEFVNMKMIIAIAFFTVHTIYTTLSMVLKRAVPDVIKALVLFLEGERNVAITIPIQYPPIRVLGWISVMILTALGLVLLLESRNRSSQLLSFTSTVGIGISYIGAVVNPEGALTRYLGLGSTVILAILSPQALEVLARRGRAGMYYSLLLVLLAIISFGFAGTLMPENPYTVNPYTAWSLSGLISYSDAQELENLATLLCCNNYLIDWSAGHYVGYKYLWIRPSFRGFYNPEAQSSFIFAGSYGLLVTPEYLESFNNILIFRKNALYMPEAYSPYFSLFLENKAKEKSIIYMSPRIRVMVMSPT